MAKHKHNFKKLILLFLSLITFILILSGCDNPITNPPPFDISVTSSSFYPAPKGTSPDYMLYHCFNIEYTYNKNTTPFSTYKVDVVYKNDDIAYDSFTVSFKEIPPTRPTQPIRLSILFSSPPYKDYANNLKLPIKERAELSPKNMFTFRISEQK